MKAKILIPYAELKVGEIVDCKYYKDLTEEEIIYATMGTTIWDKYDVFVDDERRGRCDLYVKDYAIKILKEE